MIKKFNAPCNFNGSVSPFAFWLSDDYKNGNHPLYFQTDWLSKSRGGSIDPKISEGIAQIAKISEENKISFEYLFMIAMDAALKTNAASSEAPTAVTTTISASNPKTSSETEKSTIKTESNEPKVITTDTETVNDKVSTESLEKTTTTNDI